MEENINIFYEDKDIIVCEKPAGVPSQSDKTSDYDMVNRLKNYIKRNEAVKNEPYVGLVHRLDRPVGGIMVFAKNAAALKKLNEQVRLKQISKFYLAISDHKTESMPTEWTKLTHFLVKDAKSNSSRVVNPSDKDAKLAELNYRILAVEDSKTYIEVELITGRHHQIRVQMKEIGLPLWGDTKYNTKFMENNPSVKWASIALYSYKLQFRHPVSGKRLNFENIPKEYNFTIV